MASSKLRGSGWPAEGRRGGSDGPAARPSRVVESRARAKLSFFAHVSTYVLVIGLLAAINLVRSPDHLWFLWPLAGWGVAVVAHGLSVFGFGRGGRAERFLVRRELRRPH